MNLNSMVTDRLWALHFEYDHRHLLLVVRLQPFETTDTFLRRDCKLVLQLVVLLVEVGQRKGVMTLSSLLLW